MGRFDTVFESRTGIPLKKWQIFFRFGLKSKEKEMANEY